MDVTIPSDTLVLRVERISAKYDRAFLVVDVPHPEGTQRLYFSPTYECVVVETPMVSGDGEAPPRLP